jgi:hypothetical protein
MSRDRHRDETNSIGRETSTHDSLLKYEQARLIVHNDLTEHDYHQQCRIVLSSCSQLMSFYDRHLYPFDPYSDRCRPADVLDFLFRPIESVDRYNHKYVSIRLVQCFPM